MSSVAIPRTTLEQALVDLLIVWPADRPSVVALADALAEPQEPIAWGMPQPDGTIIDCITPEEHAREPGQYTVPLYAQPKAEPVACIGMIDEEHFVEVCRKAGGNSNTTLYAAPQPRHDDEALLRQALDVLENHTAIKHPQQIYYRDNAITAIKERLA
jgi:hypothetical protein